MANPIDMNTLLNDLEKDLKKSIDAQVSGMPDSLADAIDTAQMSRKLNAQTQKISKGNLTGGGLKGTTIDSVYWDENIQNIARAKNIAQEQMDRQNWLKETEHNRLIAYTEANRLAVEVFKATVTPGGLVETTEEIIKSAAMIAAFLNEGKVK